MSNPSYKELFQVAHRLCYALTVIETKADTIGLETYEDDICALTIAREEVQRAKDDLAALGFDLGSPPDGWPETPTLGAQIVKPQNLGFLVRLLFRLIQDQAPWVAGTIVWAVLTSEIGNMFQPSRSQLQELYDGGGRMKELMEMSPDIMRALRGGGGELPFGSRTATIQ